MWNKVGSWFMDLLFGSIPDKPRPLPAPVEEEVAKPLNYKVPDWIFEGEKPPLEVVHKLNTGLHSVGDHIMYRAPETGRWAGTVKFDGKEWLTKELTYWIADGTLLDGHKYVSTRAECGVQKCVRPDHLKVKYSPSKSNTAPVKKAKPKLQVNRVQGPPVYQPPAKRKLTGISKDDLLSGDRTKCPSAKVFFETLKEVEHVAAYFNNHFREPGEYRLYGYNCDWCAGAHLTHQNPKKRPKYKHKGSWS